MQICFEDVYKRYGGKEVLRRVNARFCPPKPVCIMGPSGIGKTTLLRLAMGLETPDSGKVRLCGGDRFAPVFQEDRLCEGSSGISNLRLVVNKHTSDEELKALLGEMGLAPADQSRAVYELSGGMKRRLAIARALAAPADALVMDEPLKGLDRDTRALVVQTILRRAAGRLLLIVTHSEQEAELFGAERFVLNENGSTGFL